MRTGTTRNGLFGEGECCARCFYSLNQPQKLLGLGFFFLAGGFSLVGCARRDGDGFWRSWGMCRVRSLSSSLQAGERQEIQKGEEEEKKEET